MAVNYNPRSVTDGLCLYIIPSNPRGYLANGAAIGDLSGNYASGVLSNMSVPSCYIKRAGGTSLQFDGINDSISINNFQKLSSFTASTWVNRQDPISHILSINSPTQLVMTMNTIGSNVIANYNFNNGNAASYVNPLVTAGAFIPVPLTGASLVTPGAPYTNTGLSWTQGYQLVSTTSTSYGNPITVTLSSANQMAIESVRLWLGSGVNVGDVRLSNNINSDQPAWRTVGATFTLFTYTFSTPLVGTNIVFSFEGKTGGGLFGPIIDNFAIIGSVAGSSVNGTKLQTTVWDASNNSLSAESTIPFASSSHEMLSVTYNGGTSASSAFGVYRNGDRLSYTASSSGSFTSLNQNSANVYLGYGRDAISTYHFRGQIDDAQIYNRALSPSEIAQNYNATRGRFGI